MRFADHRDRIRRAAKSTFTEGAMQQVGNLENSSRRSSVLAIWIISRIVLLLVVITLSIVGYYTVKVLVTPTGTDAEIVCYQHHGSMQPVVGSRWKTCVYNK